MFIKQKPYYFSLLITSIFLCCFGLVPDRTYAQDFNEGIQYYKQKDFKKAVSVFNQIKSPEAYLFAGKSYYALGQYDEAQANLNNISSDAVPQIYEESTYTSALVNFQQKEFGKALSKLYTVSKAEIDGDLTDKAQNLYQQILNYLSPYQQRHAIENVSEDEIRFNLLKMGLRQNDYSEAQSLYDTFKDHVEDDKWKDQAKQYKSALKNASSFKKKFGSAAKKLPPPDGTIYTIGVALPEYQPNDQEFGIVKAMYFGALYAAEQFNDQSGSAKAYVRFMDTGTSDDRIRPVMEHFKNKDYGDVVIGPLFSGQAEPMVPIATNLKIPTIAPLANSDINADNSFLFQINPTFKTHGKQMADYAVNRLGLKNFAVLADKNSNGAVSAEAFRDEAEENGAYIEQYSVENLQNDYEISRYTKDFQSSSEPIDAVYAPFTGQRALTMIDLMVNNLHSIDQPITVLGSQEYRNLNFHSDKYHDLSIYFSESMHPQNRGQQLINFKNGYQNKFGSAGNKFSMIGYDVAHLILETLNQVGNPDLLPSALRKNPTYHGLINDIYFNGTNINKAVKIMKVSPSGDLSVQN